MCITKPQSTNHFKPAVLKHFKHKNEKCCVAKTFVITALDYPQTSTMTNVLYFQVTNKSSKISLCSAK